MARHFKLITFILILSGCTASDTEPRKDYMPLNSNFSTEFVVEEKKYTITGGEETKKYFIKETIGEVIQNINGYPVYALLRYSKPNLSYEWKLDSLWTTYKQPDKYVKIENNIPLLKIALPVKNGSIWNGNALNHLPERNYTLKVYDDKIEITHYLDSNAVELNRSREIYKRGKGMIYKEIINFQFCQSTPECIGKGIVSSGKSMIFTAQ